MVASRGVSVRNPLAKIPSSTTSGDSSGDLLKREGREQGSGEYESPKGSRVAARARLSPLWGRRDAHGVRSQA